MRDGIQKMIKELYEDTSRPTLKDMLRKVMSEVTLKTTEDLRCPYSRAKSHPSYGRYAASLSIVDFYEEASKVINPEDLEMMSSLMTRAFKRSVYANEKPFDRIFCYLAGVEEMRYVLKDYEAHVGKNCTSSRVDVILLIEQHEEIISGRYRNGD